MEADRSNQADEVLPDAAGAVAAAVAIEPDGHADVVRRVVAWHNRHPLAQRIAAAQVHSVGVVTLPFAAAGAQVETLALPPAAHGQAPAPPPAAPAQPAADAAEAANATDAPAPDAGAVQSDAEAPPAPADAPVVPSRPLLRFSKLPPRPGAWSLRDWWARRRGKAAWSVLFNEDFIAPLSPRHVAAWGLRHGQTDWPLQPQAQERLVRIDPALQRAAGDASLVPLHVLTAAIGSGDARQRVLLAPDAKGPVIGPRHWDRRRIVAGAGASAALGLALATTLVAMQGNPGDAVTLAAAPAASVASTAPAASAPRAASAAAAQASVAPVATAAAAASVAAAASPASAASAASVASAASAVSNASVSRVVPASATAQASASRLSRAPAVASTRASTDASAPRGAVARRATEDHTGEAAAKAGRIELPPLVPRIDADARAQARQQAQLLRADTRPAGDRRLARTKAYALVTRTTASKSDSERAAAQLRALALLQPVPMRADLMRAAGGWRAAFWPFDNPREAEKARLALSDKGLRTEVVEF